MLLTQASIRNGGAAGKCMPQPLQRSQQSCQTAGLWCTGHLLHKGNLSNNRLLVCIFQVGPPQLSCLNILLAASCWSLCLRLWHLLGASGLWPWLLPGTWPAVGDPVGCLACRCGSCWLKCQIRGCFPRMRTCIASNHSWGQFVNPVVNPACLQVGYFMNRVWSQWYTVFLTLTLTPTLTLTLTFWC